MILRDTHKTIVETHPWGPSSIAALTPRSCDGDVVAMLHGLSEVNNDSAECVRDGAGVVISEVVFGKAQRGGEANSVATFMVAGEPIKGDYQ